MHLSFDLISDLHLDSHETLDWTGQATSTICVVAGDISRDLEVVKQTLTHLGQCYNAVFYIDGNNEHRHHLDTLDHSYLMLEKAIANIPNVVFLQNNCVIISGVAIIGTNGWWTWDLDDNIDPVQCKLWWTDVMKTRRASAERIHALAEQDALYMINSIRRLQKHPDVKRIVVVTHTVPFKDLISHDLRITDTYEFNKMGNRLMMLALDEDSENKIDTWCFGHYHDSVDQKFSGIRYVNNCRGRAEDADWQPAFYPKRITINY